MRDYLLDISFDARDADLEERVDAQLFLAGSLGTSAVEVAGTTTISAWFDTPAARGEAEALLAGIEPIEVHSYDRERVDWLDLYQQSLHAIEIGQRFIVAPDRALLPSGTERHGIVIPQEQAFGTGSHETTALCVELLETLDLRGRRGLDIGSGSGILAIAMHRLGAAPVIAFDNDPDAYAALRDNRIRNGVAPEAMPLFIGGVEALSGGRFDVATMNIIPEVILPLLGRVVMLLAPAGQLILSGVLVTRRDEVVLAAERHPLRLEREREKGEWWAALFARSGNV